MKISKTTIKFAESRDIELDINNDKLYIYFLDDSEPDLIYLITDTGFFFSGSLLPKNVSCELPHWVQDEKHLRAVIDFVNNEIN